MPFFEMDWRNQVYFKGVVSKKHVWEMTFNVHRFTGVTKFNTGKKQTTNNTTHHLTSNGYKAEEHVKCLFPWNSNILSETI